MDTLDLLKSLTEGVNKKVEQEEDIEYKVNTSLKGAIKKKVADDRTYINNSGHISEEKKSVNLDENISSKKSKVDRGGNPFKRGPRNKKVSNDSSLKSSVDLVAPVIQDIPEDIIEDLNCVEEIVDTQDIVSENIEPLEEIVDIEMNEDEIISEEVTEEIVDLEESPEEIVSELQTDLKEDLEDTLDTELKEPVIVEEDFDLSFDFSEIKETENIEEIEISENIETEEFNVESENIDKLEISDINDSLSIEPVNELDETDETDETDELVDSNDTKEDITSSNVDSSDSISEANQEDEKFKNCIYYKGMDVEEFLRENPNYRDTIFVEHFFSKEVINKLLYSGMIHIRKGQYRL